MAFSILFAFLGVFRGVEGGVWRTSLVVLFSSSIRAFRRDFLTLSSVLYFEALTLSI